MLFHGIQVILMRENPVVTTELDKSLNCLKSAVKTGNYVHGYMASLVYVMNGLAKVVLVSTNLPEKDKEILLSNCKISSVPLLEIPLLGKKLDTDNFPLRDDVFTIVDPRVTEP